MSELPHGLMVLWAAILLDLVLCEPPNAVHPVAWCGRVISAFQRRAPNKGRAMPLLAGAVFVLTGVACVFALGLILSVLLRRLPTPLGLLAEAAALKLTFSVRGLVRASHAVRSALESGDLRAARGLLGCHLVSRDTSSLSESQVAAATIESVSENASDAFIAPLLCYVLAGLPGAFVYRFINTCDAMLGYRDKEREWLGKAAARLDDLVNLLPARLTAGLIVVGGVPLGGDPIHAVRIWFRDRNLTESPNAGHPMSAAAGVLGVELEKIGHYRLGWGQRQPVAADIARAERLLWRMAAMAVIALSAVLHSIP